MVSETAGNTDNRTWRRINRAEHWFFFFSKILRNESGLDAATQTDYIARGVGDSDQNSHSRPPSQESRATETTEGAPSNEAHALKLREAEALVALLRAENLAHKNEVRVRFSFEI